MIYLKKNSKVMIIVLVFIVSFGLGIKYSHIINSFKNENNEVYNKTISKEFELVKNKSKVIINIESEDFIKDIDQYEKLIDKYNSNVLLSERNEHYLLSLMEVPSDNMDNILADFYKFDFFKSEKKIMRSKDVYINVDERIENYKLTKNKLKNLIAETNLPERMDQYYSQLKSVQNSLDSLITVKSEMNNQSNNDIILLKLIRKQTKNVSLTSRIFILLKYTFFSIILISIVLIVLYLLMLLLMSVMKLLGIKNARSSAGYYGKYSVNNRKVKRVYKKMDDNKE